VSLLREEGKGKGEEGWAGASAVEWRTFGAGKKGAGEGEYEDAVAFAEEPGTGELLRVAVADGATEAVFSRRWARLLVEGFVAGGPSVLGDELAQVQGEWQAYIERQSEQQSEARAGALPWYVAEKAEAGAFAALLGVELHAEREGGGAWSAVSVGDCNLFHLRKDRLLEAWPRAQAADFDDRPALVPSRPGADCPEARHAEGTFQRGDAFVLSTDAAAAWLLETDPAEALRWNGQAIFADAVQAGRANNMLKNDDTTVAVLRVK
jgi:hypothetical protein